MKEYTPESVDLKENDWKKPPNTVTRLSKYLTFVLFVILPFLGFWLGSHYGKQTHQPSTALNTTPKQTETLELPQQKLSPPDETATTSNVDNTSEPLTKKLPADDVFLQTSSEPQNLAIFESVRTNQPYFLFDIDHSTSTLAFLSSSTLVIQENGEVTETINISAADKLSYSGHGIFQDSDQFYLTTNNTVSTILYQVISELNPNLPTKVLSAGQYHDDLYLVNGTTVYALASDSRCEHCSGLGDPYMLIKVKNIRAETFVPVGGGYFKDKDRVFYNTGTEWSTRHAVRTIPQANPDTFTMLTGDDLHSYNVFGTDNVNVYHHGSLLEGINLTTARFEQGGNIVRSGDVVWMNRGGCNYQQFERSSISQIPYYSHSC